MSSAIATRLPLEWATWPTRQQVAYGCFLAASWLTEPLCNVRETIWREKIVSRDHSSSTVEKVRFAMTLLGWSGAALFTAFPGACLRSLGVYIQGSDVTHWADPTNRAKRFQAGDSVTVLFWNICAVVGGYEISDGGVEHWTYRIDRIAAKIREKNPDVLCLAEVFDFRAAVALCERLKEVGYTDFYFNMGSGAVTVGSGLFVATKYRVDSFEFTPFPKEMLIGDTKKSSKGFCTIETEAAAVVVAHLQHSEMPSKAEEDEETARSAQMRLIAAKVARVAHRCIVTGDFNLGPEEYQKNRLVGFDSDFRRITWKGDAFCRELVGRSTSAPMQLDYVFARGGVLTTELIETGYDPKKFDRKALSDHEGLFSTFT